jgi:hypothetical protein
VARRPFPGAATDLDEVTPLFQKSGILPSKISAPQAAILKRIHLSTYSLILWRFRLKKLPAHGVPFIEEIASDALQILPHTLRGYNKSAVLLTRGIIENVFRHIYFSDHPIEFARMNRDKKWYQTIDFLQDYLKSHPIFIEVEPRYDAIAKLTSLYSELSAVVHGRTVGHLQMKLALKELTYDSVIAGKLSDNLVRCVAACNFLLAAFHKEQVDRFHVEDRRLILRTMPAHARNVWGDI